MDEFKDVPPHKMVKWNFVTLANESPARNYDSEDSTYDSFHARETGKLVDIRLLYKMRLHFIKFNIIFINCVLLEGREDNYVIYDF